MGFLYHLQANQFMGLAKKLPLFIQDAGEPLFLFFLGNTEVLNEIEENQYNLEKKSTEGMDQLKKKINELQSVSMDSQNFS